MRRASAVFVVLPFLACTAPAWAGSGLMVRCNIAGAEVWLGDKRIGPCPGQFVLTPGTAQLMVRKDKDLETEWYWTGEVRLQDDKVTQIDVQLKEHRTQVGLQREMERLDKARREEEARREERRRLTAPRAEQLSGEFVTITGGDFQMGDLYGDGDQNEKPVHKVHVNDFRLAKYEVTQWQWRQVMGGDPSEHKDCGDDCPVENVSLDDIQSFLAKLNAQTGKHYRLPTEAEWEYACRSGGKQQRYCGGDDPQMLAWYDQNAEGTHPVGGKQPNGLGLYDMSGNVWEWTCSEYGDHYAGSEKVCAGGADAKAPRVARGGSWCNGPGYARVSNRLGYDPAYRLGERGVRLAQDL